MAESYKLEALEVPEMNILDVAEYFRGRTLETIEEGDKIAMFPFAALVLEHEVDDRLTA